LCRSAVGCVEWNITGFVFYPGIISRIVDTHSPRTVLSSAGNDGRVRLWKATIGNVWRPAGSIGVEQSEDTQDADVNMGENAIAE
jgi:nucleoporin SEH1